MICALLLSAWLSAALSAQVQCGIHSVRGNWAMSALGWATPLQPPGGQPAPIVMIGVMSIDHAGKMSGPGTAIWGGDVIDFEMVNGTVEVNADCTGTMRYGLKLRTPQGPVVVPGYFDRFILIPDKQEMMSATTASPLSKPMWIGTAKRISPVPAAVNW